MLHDKWGHQGVNRTFELLRRRCYWPGMHHDVKKHIRKCYRCTASKSPTPTVRPPLRHLLAFQPQEIVAMDFLKLDRGVRGFEDVLVLTDIFSKFSQAIPCRDQTGMTVAKALRDHWFIQYGVPARLHSDQGTSFENEIIRELCRLYGMTKSRTTPYHPSGNGQCERFNKTLCSLIKSLAPQERRKWPELVQHVVYMYNTTPHSVTGVSPYFLMFGRQPVLPVDHLLNRLDDDWEADYVDTQSKLMKRAHQIVSTRLQQVAERERKRHNRRATDPNLEIGARVLLRRNNFTSRHKLADKFHETPYVVVSKSEENDVYEIRPVMGGGSKWVNRRQLVIDPRGVDEEVPVEFLPNIMNDDYEEMNTPPDCDQDEEDEDDEDYPSFRWIYDGSVPQEGQGPRRSARTSKGVNRNPGRIPTSVITGLPE